MVVDGGGRFSPVDTVVVYTLSLLLSSQSAHDRAAGNTREHKRRQTLTNGTWVQYKPRQRGMNSVPR